MGCSGGLFGRERVGYSGKYIVGKKLICQIKNDGLQIYLIEIFLKVTNWRQIMDMFNDYGWSTHQPLIRSLLDMFKPEFILELGVGVFSTPIFIAYGSEKLMCIENDAEWLRHVKKEYAGNHTMLLHQLEDGVDITTLPSQLTPIQRNNISNYYSALSKSLLNKNQHPKMLFVDNFASCRTLAINVLYRNFDILVYHDCEPVGKSFYQYYFVEALGENFNHYVLKTPKSWAATFIHRDLHKDMLEHNIGRYIEAYCAENNLDNNQIYLEKRY